MLPQPFFGESELRQTQLFLKRRRPLAKKLPGECTTKACRPTSATLAKSTITNVNANVRDTSPNLQTDAASVGDIEICHFPFQLVSGHGQSVEEIGKPRCAASSWHF